MKKLLAPLLLLVSALLLQCGCTNVDAIIITGLRVELTGIERAGDGTVSVAWQVVNPNVASYLVDSVSNKIYLNGSLVGTTLSGDPLGVPAQGSSARTSRLALAGPAAERILIDAAAQGTAGYRVDSNLIIRIYGDDTSKGQLTHSGSVTVVSK